MTNEEFLVQAPLYDVLKLDGNVLKKDSSSLDCYCIECKKTSVFRASEVTEVTEVIEADDFDTHEHELFVLHFTCSRDHDHKIHFVIKVRDEALWKIGQWPSLADLAEASLRKYTGVLEREDHRELVKAVGLAAHGVGIGSFVYLRRIFERLIEEAHQEEKGSAHWDEAAYGRARMGEKIQMLKAHLPEFLVEQHSLYGIISKWLHELSEQECLDSFPIVRAGIELILDQKLALKEQRKKMEAAREQIQALREKLTSPGSAPKTEAPPGKKA
jgi:hypothetical protein